MHLLRIFVPAFVAIVTVGCALKQLGWRRQEVPERSSSTAKTARRCSRPSNQQGRCKPMNLAWRRLHQAVRRGDHAQVLHLLDMGTGPNVFNDEGLTPLMVASMLESPSGDMASIMSILLLKGASTELTALDGTGRTALHFAAAAADGGTRVAVLMGHGANVRAEDGLGCTPADLAANADVKECLTFAAFVQSMADQFEGTLLA